MNENNNKKPIKWDDAIIAVARGVTIGLLAALIFHAADLNRRVTFLEGALREQVEINEQVVRILESLVKGNRT